MITATQAMHTLLDANPGCVVTNGIDSNDYYIFTMLGEDGRRSVDAYKAVRKSDGAIFNYAPDDLMEFYEAMMQRPIKLDGMVEYRSGM